MIREQLKLKYRGKAAIKKASKNKSGKPANKSSKKAAPKAPPPPTEQKPEGATDAVESSEE